MSDQAKVSQLADQAAYQGSVLLKLLLFTLALAVAPLSSYYLSLTYLWNGNTTFAAITAIVAANIVLVAYIIVSLIEERKGNEGQVSKPKEAGDSETKKTK
ncbi:hypothetical protein C8Q75DRAFT_862440 [Abortiporus biennis]|nr:hypothetical protein C8Q75DRAFT_862440 [Abortiporus biennis]